MRRGSTELSPATPSPEQLCMSNQNRIFKVSILKHNSIAYKIRVKIFLYISHGNSASMGSALGVYTAWKSLAFSWYFGIKAVVTSFLNPL